MKTQSTQAVQFQLSDKARRLIEAHDRAVTAQVTAG